MTCRLTREQEQHMLMPSGTTPAPSSLLPRCSFCFSRMQGQSVQEYSTLKVVMGKIGLTKCSTDPPSMLYSLAVFSSFICFPAKMSLQANNRICSVQGGKQKRVLPTSRLAWLPKEQVNHLNTMSEVQSPHVIQCRA